MKTTNELNSDFEKVAIAFTITMRRLMCGTLGVVLALTLASEVDAQGKGPRASVSSATTCALELDISSGQADLVITTTLTNKSSGDTVAELRDGSQIQGTFKKQDVRGNAFFDLDADPVSVSDVPPDEINPSLTVSATFDLCSEEENVTAARELNGTATMAYGISGGVGDDREVENRCTDDPYTEDVNEGGIKVDDATFSAIAEACGW